MGAISFRGQEKVRQEKIPMSGRAAAERSRARFAFLTGLLFATALLVSGCGGGGGGGDGGGGGGSGDAYSISSNSVSFSTTFGGATPAPQAVNVSANSGAVFIATSQAGSGFTHSFVITGPTTGRITITPDPPNQPGNFTGTITVRGCATQICGGNDVPGSPKTINVSYTVGGAATLSVTPPTIDFETTPSVTPDPQNVTLSLSSGSLAWSVVAVNYTGGTPGWLTLPMSGMLSPSQTIALSVSPAATPGVRNATVTFNAGSLLKDLPVSYTINAVGVNFVSPYVATTGVGGNVIIRGHGFTGATSVSFGGVPAVPGSLSVVSDTEIRASYPALFTLGAQPVQVGSLSTRANLFVVSPAAFAAVNLARSVGAGNPANLVYDAERRALFVMDPVNNAIERYRFVSGTTWNVDTPFSVGVGGGNPRIALSPDGTELLKTSGNGTLLHRVNPAAIPLALMSPPTNVDASSLLGGGSLNLIAFANDGRAVGNASSPSTGITLYRYHMLNQTFTASSTQVDMTNRTIVASGDGDTLVLPTFESLAPGFFKPVVTYDASAGTLTSRSSILTSQTDHASVSRDGSRMILRSAQTATVYDFVSGTLTVRGNLPAGLTGFVISPDGAFAYGYFASPSPIIRTFDLNIGGFPPTGGSVAINSPGTSFNAMTISPDGGTLFIAGNQSISIVPAP